MRPHGSAGPQPTNHLSANQGNGLPRNGPPADAPLTPLQRRIRFNRMIRQGKFFHEQIRDAIPGLTPAEMAEIRYRLYHGRGIDSQQIEDDYNMHQSELLRQQLLDARNLRRRLEEAQPGFQTRFARHQRMRQQAARREQNGETQLASDDDTVIGEDAPQIEDDDAATVLGDGAAVIDADDEDDEDEDDEEYADLASGTRTRESSLTALLPVPWSQQLIRTFNLTISAIDTLLALTPTHVYMSPAFKRTQPVVWHMQRSVVRDFPAKLLEYRRQFVEWLADQVLENRRNPNIPEPGEPNVVFDDLANRGRAPDPMYYYAILGIMDLDAQPVLVMLGNSPNANRAVLMQSAPLMRRWINGSAMSDADIMQIRNLLAGEYKKWLRLLRRTLFNTAPFPPKQ